LTNELETPVTLLPDTTDLPVEFTPAQQEKLDEILKKAMGRAGADARKEAADLKAKLAKSDAENKRLQEIAAGRAPDSTELEKASAEVSALAMERDAIKATAEKQARDAFITAQAQKNDFLAHDVVVKLTRDNLQWNGSGYTVLADDGTARTAADGSPLTPEAFYAEYAEQRPYLVKGQVKSGGGGTSSAGSGRAPTAYDVAKLFGPGSVGNSAEVNRMSIQQPELYKKLRAEAKARNLVV